MPYLDPNFSGGSPLFITVETGIDDSVQTETTEWLLLEIAPATGAPLSDVTITFDLNKATTGFGAVETSATIGLGVARKIDGTNWRREPYPEAVLSGTLAAVAPGRSWRIIAGDVGVTQGLRVYADMSADATADMVLPYVISYRGRTAPTVTPVVNG